MEILTAFIFIAIFVSLAAFLGLVTTITALVTIHILYPNRKSNPATK